jgi:hypothetical protein
MLKLDAKRNRKAPDRFGERQYEEMPEKKHKKEDVLMVEEELIPVLSTGIKLLRLLSQPKILFPIKLVRLLSQLKINYSTTGIKKEDVLLVVKTR